MIKHFFIPILLLIFLPGFASASNIAKKLEKGKTVIIDVTPIGDAYTDLSEQHVIKVYTLDNKYFIELIRNDAHTKREISAQQLNEIINFISKWKAERTRLFHGGLSYDLVKIKAGRRKYRFRSDFHSDNTLLAFFM